MPGSVKNIIASAVTLTTTQTASTKTAKCKSSDKHSIYLDWVPGVIGNVLTVIVEFTPNGTDWYQDMLTTNSSGTLSRQLLQYQFTAAGTTTTKHRLDLKDILAEELRVTYSESSAGGAGKGTITVTVESNSSAC